MPDAHGIGESMKPNIIAVCGKGGAGKTSISAMMTKLLMERAEDRILAVDADPAVGLAAALGMAVKRTVDDIRMDLVREVRSGQKGDRREWLERLDYEVLGALEERRNMAFLAIGRPETAGCYCRVNELLKEIIVRLSQSFDHVVIDGEAGIEQVNRRVMASVTHLVLVSDPSLKGVHVCETIHQVASSVMSFQTAGLIVNRVREEDLSVLPPIPPRLNPVGTIPDSDIIRRFDLEGREILSLPDGPALQALQGCMVSLGLL